MSGVGVLFLGGPVDGRREVVPTINGEPHGVHRVEELPSSAVHFNREDIEFCATPVTHYYQRHMATDEDGRPYWFYVHQDLCGVKSPFEVLVERYPKETRT
jgi:hypothetical protein